MKQQKSVNQSIFSRGYNRRNTFYLGLISSSSLITVQTTHQSVSQSIHTRTFSFLAANKY